MNTLIIIALTAIAGYGLYQAVAWLSETSLGLLDDLDTTDHRALSKSVGLESIDENDHE